MLPSIQTFFSKKPCQSAIASDKPGKSISLVSRNHNFSFLVFFFSILIQTAEARFMDDRLGQRLKFGGYDFEPKTDIFIGGGVMQADLNRLNRTLPAGARTFDSDMGAVVFGFTTYNRRFSFSNSVGVFLRQRSVFSDYEQVFMGRANWNFSFGRHLFVNDKMDFIVTPMLGFSWDQYTLQYHNDSFAKPASMDWIVRRQNALGDNEGDYNRYVNPSFALLASLRVMKTIKDRFTISALVSYQHDVGSGKWHYDYGFRRMNSPDTYSSGLMFNLNLGVLVKKSDVN